MAVAVARERGFRVDEAKSAAQIAAIRTQLPSLESSINVTVNLEGLFPLVALAAAGVQQDEMTDGEIYRILGGQHASGRWTPGVLRPPVDASSVSQTAWAIRALRFFAPPIHAAEIESRVVRAITWLDGEMPAETEEVAMRLLAFGWAAAGSDRIQRTTNHLLALQRPDGGWGQMEARPSDAYATGQAMVALNQAGRVSPASSSYRKGIAFLTSTQHADGSWLVETRRRTWKRGLPYLESGFPYGMSQFISYAGSAWATMALALNERDQRSQVVMGDPRTTNSRRLLPSVRSNEDADMRSELTPLMRAALRGSLEEFRALLEEHPDVNAATPLGVTALMWPPTILRRLPCWLLAAQTCARQRRVPEATKTGLAALGHKLDIRPLRGVGAVKAIVINQKTGALIGGVSPTRESYVMGW
jgi:hypothetical protein